MLRKKLHFPDDRSVGKLYDLGDISRRSLEQGAKVLEASGTIDVDKASLLKLEVSKEASQNLSFLENLGPEDLTFLELSETLISDGELQHLRGLGGLSSLSLNRTKLTDKGLDHLSALTGLHHLEVRETLITDAGASQLGRMANLRSLDLSFTAITNATVANLKPLKLNTLYLNYTRVTDDCVADLCNFPELIVLGLEGISIVGAGITALSCLKDLHMLLLSHTAVNDQHLGFLRFLPDLRELHLEYTKISTLALSELRECRSLEYLYVEGCEIDPVAWSELTREIEGLTVFH